MNILNSIQTALNTPSNIQTEVDVQLSEARELIGTWQAAQALTSKLINIVPRLVNARKVGINFKDDRDNEVTVDKDLNDIMWLIALQSTLESGSVTTQGLVALFKQFADKELTGVTTTAEGWYKISARFTRELINIGLVQNVRSLVEIGGELRKVHKLTKAMMVEMQDATEELRAAVPMKMKPLTNRPNDWTDNDTGIAEGTNVKLIKGGQRSIAQPVLNAVNKLQRVGFIVPQHMSDAGRLVADNPDYYGVKKSDKGEFITAIYTEIAKYAGETVHFPVTMDKRGRMYYRGGLLTPQGEDFCKAAFQFSEFKLLGERGFDAIAIHTANVCGMDKISINDRISWVQSNIDSGTFANIRDFNDVMEVFPSADKFQATVAILEINRILATGMNPALVESNLVCHQDGTCNGLQHMAALTGNRETAISVNCTASTLDDVPNDIYGIIADEAALIAEQRGLTAELHLIRKYGRSMAKKPVMIVGYGAGKETVCIQTGIFLQEKGEEQALGQAVGELYMEALASKAEAVKTFVDTIKSRMKMAIEKGIDTVTWTTADGLVCEIAYTDIEDKRVRAGAFNTIKSDGEVLLDEVKTEGAMAPNLVHSIDATHLRMVINKCDFDLVTVHDSIGSHPSDFFTTAEAIRTEFVAVHEYDALANLTTSLDVSPIRFMNRDAYKAEEALQSTYIFS